MDNKPKIVILDIKKEFDAFCKRVEPLLVGTDYTPSGLIEFVWISFGDRQIMDDMIPDAIDTILPEEEYDGPMCHENVRQLSSELWNFCRTLAFHLNSNELYGSDNLMPYHLRFHPHLGLYLKYDTEWKKELEKLRSY